MIKCVARSSLLVVTMHVLVGTAVGQSYRLAFSTYFGGSAGDGIRDVEVDGLGNIYVAGTTRSPDFPTTPGAYDEQLDGSLGTTRWGYNSEIFVAKFSPTGGLVWSTVVGGPNSEEAYGLEIDSKGYVIVHGRGARGSPVTEGVYQGQFKGCGGEDPGNPHNTAQNAYVCKLTPDGSSLVWGSFFGVDHLHRDLALDKNDDIYVTWGVRPGENDPSHWNTWMDPAWKARAFQPDPQGGNDCGVAKISSDGSHVLWATYLGGSDDDSIEASIDVDDSGYVYVGLQTRSTDIPTTPGAHDRTHNGGVDWYVAGLLPDGSDIVYGTYIGDEGDNWLNTHNLVVDGKGNCYSSTCAFSSFFPTTTGAIQTIHGGGNVDWGIVKLSPAGVLLAGTLLGGNGGDNPDGIRIDSQGNLVLFGQSSSADFPVSANAYQSAGSEDDAVVVKLSPNLDRLIYGTFLGGNGNDAGRAGCVGKDGSMIVAGSTSGDDWPTKNAFQNVRNGPGDAIVARFVPAETITVNPAVTYQTITGWEATACVAQPNDPAFPNYRDTLFDMLVNDIGINRVRLEVRSGVENINDNWSAYQAGDIVYETWRSRRYATVNDNSDPCEINWAGFHFSEIDHTIDNVVAPLRQLLEARGEHLFVNVNYVAFTGQIQGGETYMHDDPAEYAEFVLATYQHLQSKYGWVPDAWEVLLEPDNVAQWNGALLGEAIVATAGRLKANGFTPAFIAPSNTNMANAITYFDQMVQVPGALQFLRELSYHRYSGVSTANLQTIASRARQHGVDTSMLEWWTEGNSYVTLHEDLKVGNNSAWQQAAVRGFFVVDDTDPHKPIVSIDAKSKFTRQYYKFVRPSAVRIEATCDSSSLDPVAFVNEDGKYVVVVKCGVGGDFSIQGLAAGTYGVKYTTSSQYDVDLPAEAIEAGQVLNVSIPAAGVLTVYAKATSSDNETPSVPTGLSATAASASRINLSWASSTDNVGVAGYRIYRDGVRIAFWPGNSYTDTGLAASTSYTYSVSAYDAAGNESGKSSPVAATTQPYSLESGLVGYWKLDNRRGVTTSDSSGGNNDGTVSGATWTAGKIGNGLDFDGFNDYVRIRENPGLDNLDAFTMAAWIYPRVDSHWHVLDKGDGDKRIYAEGTELVLNGRVRYTGAHAYCESLGNTVVLGTWQHVAMTWSRSDNTARLYYNGAEVEYAVQDIGSGSVLEEADYPFVIGARGALGDVTFFNGIIDEVRLYDRALSVREVSDLYNYLSSGHSEDLNGDFKVDSGDLFILAAQWLWLGPAGLIREDIVGDGSVDFLDFTRLAQKWLARWNQPPSVDITAPQDGARVYRGRPTQIVADAWDSDGSVVLVEFFVEQQKIGEDDSVVDGWAQSWQPTTLGIYSITAKATDNEGAFAVSPAVSIEAVNPPR